jgi:serine/threonine protein phosphatase PrpC
VSVAAVEGERCGDAWAVAEAGGFLSVFIVDGLGHGAGAEAAATAAVNAFLEEPADHPEAVLRRVHEAMLGTRGGVAAVCRIDTAGGRSVFAGIGNITGRLFVGDRSQAFVSGHGSVGTQVAFPRPRVDTAPWDVGTALVFASDGLRSNFDLDAGAGLPTCHPALSAAVILRNLRKGNDDATVVIARNDGCGTR